MPMSDSSQPTITPFPGDQMASISTCTQVKHSIHIHTKTHNKLTNPLKNAWLVFFSNYMNGMVYVRN